MQSAFAQSASYEPPVTLLSDAIDYDVRADGTFSREVKASYRINNDQGVKLLGQISSGYSTSLQELEVIAAYTITKDGRRLDVPSDKIMLQQSRLSANAPTFDDQKVKTIVFPDVEPGAVVSVHLRKTQKTPLFPGAFSMFEEFPRSHDIVSATLTLRVPKALPLAVDAVDLSGGEVDSGNDDSKLWRFSIEHTTAHAPELGSVNLGDVSPRVTATTFPSYEAAASAYLDRAGPKAAV
ncbi:MAG TPA: DUF3857 domain-containing protein, partial [Telmatospirillum sp.]|nr:DUF3857 domain-containing protein [Telmatospirillum sp.]